MGHINKQSGNQVFAASPQSTAGYIRRQYWTNAVATDADRLKNDLATSDSLVTTVTTFLAQPDFARQITITPGGTTTDVPAGDVTITGTNIRGEVITDTITFAANASTVGATLKAFKTVTSIVFPVQDGASATYDVGVNDVLGLDRCMSEAAVIDCYVDGVRETTAATVTFNATDVSKNTIDTNTALNAARDISAIFIATEVTDKVGSTS